MKASIRMLILLMSFYPYLGVTDVTCTSYPKAKKAQRIDLDDVVWGDSKFTALANVDVIDVTGYIFESEDGREWKVTRQRAGERYWSIAADHERAIISGNDFVLLNDGQGNWLQFDVELSFHPKVVVDKYGYIRFDHLVVKSSEDGREWKRELYIKEGKLIDVDLYDDVYLVLVTNNTLEISLKARREFRIIQWKKDFGLMPASLAYNGHRMVVVGENGLLKTSIDGVTWITPEIELSSNINLNRVSWNENRFLVVGDCGVLLKSVDGMLWSKYESGEGQSFLGSAGNSGIEVVVGESPLDAPTNQVGSILVNEKSAGWSKVIASNHNSAERHDD